MSNNRVLVPYRDTDRVPPYHDALVAVGLDPVLWPVTEPVRPAEVQGLLLMGGNDVDPSLYGEAARPETETPDPQLDSAELAALRWALDEDLPVFAICRGLQLMNVAHGGTLHQHLLEVETHRRRDGDRSLPVHSVAIESGTLLAEIVGAPKLDVNSRHHQGIRQLGEGLRISARNPADGLVEGVERPDKNFVLAVQWHPEDQIHRDPVQLRLFRSFAGAISERPLK